MKYITLALAFLSVAIWSYNMGTVNVAQADEKPLAYRYMQAHCELLANENIKWYECNLGE